MLRGSQRWLWPLLVWAAACSDSAGPEASGGNAPMSARVGGQNWSSGAAGVYGSASRGQSGTYVITATGIAGASSTSITLTLYNIRGTGTYPLGMTPTTVGGIGIVTENAAGWSTPLSGAAGTVTITTLDTRIAGTFEFTASAAIGGATGDRQVTNGRFDFLLGGAAGSQPAANAGHMMSGTVGGTTWHASTVVANSVLNNTLIVTASNTAYILSFTVGGFTGPAAYPLTFGGTPGRNLTVQRVLGNQQGSVCCWGGAGSTGTFTVATMTPARITGTFVATLTPVSGTTASGTVAVTGGTFDLGRQ